MDSNGKFIDLEHFSINGFANGWFVDKILPEKIKVKFMPQDNFTQGIIISVASSILVFTFLVYLDYKRRIK